MLLIPATTWMNFRELYLVFLKANPKRLHTVWFYFYNKHKLINKNKIEVKLQG